MDFKEWFTDHQIDENACVIIRPTCCGYECVWSFEELNEDNTRGRYSVQINYRSKIQEVMDSFAKIALGYASAALKKSDFHVRHVFDEKPFRIFVSSRNWDDGEWVALASWNAEKNCFVIGKGFYKKETGTVALQGVQKCSGETPADVAKDIQNMMHHLRNKPDRHQEKLKPVPLKRGPK